MMMTETARSVCIHYVQMTGVHCHIQNSHVVIKLCVAAAFINFSGGVGVPQIANT